MSSPSRDDEFAHIIRLAPLVSIDLIIGDGEQKLFVALTNEPAKGLYFVPGCIRKDETIENAFARPVTGQRACVDFLPKDAPISSVPPARHPQG
jgi:hypothetical protein